MTLVKNFDQVTIEGSKLTIAGSSDDPDDSTLVARQVTLQQGEHCVVGPAEGHSKWRADPPFASQGYAVGPATGMATETYIVTDPDDANAVPQLVTFTWTQLVNIE